FHYEVSYDVYLLDTDGETCLKKEDWGDVEVDGQLSWRSTYDHNGGSAATGAKISSTNTSTHGTNTNTDYDEALIVAEHELEDGTVYYSVFYTGDLTDNWLEIWGFDQLPVKITGLSEGQAIALRNVTITCRLTNDDEYVNFFSGTGINSTNVKHKAAKWYGVRESTSENKYNDSFDEDNPMMTLADGTTEVQAAHEMVDTIYMLKGTSIDILIPQTYGSNQCSINNYFRWYNYLNDKNLYVGDSNTGLGSGGDIYDLITPVPYGSHDITAHRFANGYVTGDLNSTSASTQLGTDTYAYEHTLREISFYYPTDDEWTTGSLGSTLGQTDNSYYAIACDLSVYIDFSASTDYNPGTQDYKPFCSDNEWCEPTLAGRDVYYIIGIDPQSETSTAPSGLPDEFKQYWQLFDASYQGGGNGEGTHYLEEFEITMPSRHISTKTDEMVALTKDAQSYALPGETTPGALTVSFASGEDNGLTLYAVDESGYAISGITEISLSGTDRVIQFYKDTSKSYAWTVDDESTATILVTKTVDATTYNIARYKLTFKEEAIPLTEPQVHSLDDVPEESEWWWRDMYYRAPNYIDENYKLVTSLDFDYGDYGDGDLNTKTIYAPLSTSRWPGAVYNYPFPLKWDACSYSFYDGSYDTYPLAAGKALTEDPGGDGNYRVQTSWCMYDIVNWYVGYGEVYGLTPNSPQYPSVKNHEGSWLYVDASDRPGTVAELTFENDLCHGAQLAVTAWIKSDDSNTKQDDAAVMLTVTGVMVDDEGNETHTPIYRQYSGQIEATGTLSEDCESDQSITGKGSGTNEWFQTYFSFRVPDVAYDYYTVRVDNCCASTDGGDFYLDEVRVYCRNASVDVVQANSICGDSDGKSLVKVDVDYESIMQYLTDKDPADYLVSGDDLDGVTPETYSVDFVIVNRVVYEDYLASHITDGMSDAEILNVQKEAIDKAAVPIYYEYDSQEDSYG
ncbi:MAG: hypothetical protein LUC33_04025, partial [Prevotellaceae bacterium]|nr:hypothetical protein [Prevotellaceae bacterium]